MHITVLTDNHTYIDQYYLGEPAFSCWIETGGSKILFDAGYSDVFRRNADAMQIPVQQADAVVLSHGHNDHTGGLAFWPGEEKTEKPQLIAHPGVLQARFDENRSIGCPVDKGQLEGAFSLHFSTQPVWLTDRLVFLGEIAESVQKRAPIGTLIDGTADLCMDDSALAYAGNEGVYVITGCSHSGICNILEQARRVTGKKKVLGVLGGFHLFKNDERAQKTLAYLKDIQVQELWPCHCTSFAVRAQLSREIRVHEVGVGLTLDWE